MASFGNGISPTEGSAGDFTFYMRNGRVVMRQKHRRVNESERTPYEMLRRCSWGNVISGWKALKTSIQDLFEKEERYNRSAYNWFTSLNGGEANVYLTKEQSERGYCAVNHFYVSHGSLTPCVDAKYNGRSIVSDLNIGDLQIDEQTRICDLSRALLSRQNAPLQSGDELIFIYTISENDFDEEKDEITNFRYTPCRWSIRLSLIDQRLILSVLGFSIRNLRKGLLNHDGCLAADLNDEGLGCWVVKRTDASGRVQVTTQRLEGEDYLLDKFSSDEQRFKAVYSYGPVRQYSVLDPRSNPNPKIPLFTPEDDD